MSVQANASGEISGKFTIPAEVRAGAKLVELIGAGGSRGLATFVGSGEIVDIVRQRVTTVRQERMNLDPLAQTFTLQNRAQIAAADVWICAQGSTRVRVQIRETEVGMPNQRVVAESEKFSADLVVGAFNRFDFEWPALLQAGQEYALVVLTDDAEASAGVAELGKWDATSQSWVTSQPFQIGVLLSSSNASTWTPHQDRDLTFRLLRAQYSATTRAIDLGVVAVVDCTDLYVAGAAVVPDESTRLEYRLTMPDASQIIVAGEQIVSLPSAVTGDIRIEAILHGTQDFSPILFPGTQLVWGTLASSGTYISRAMTAGMNSRVRVIFDALIPSGSSVQVHVSGVDVDDDWESIPSIGSPVPLDNGWHEFSFEDPDVDENMIRVKITLTGTPAARPRVSNLRVMVM